eukprot:7376854-Prymnesium_polylepis.2
MAQHTTAPASASVGRRPASATRRLGSRRRSVRAPLVVRPAAYAFEQCRARRRAKKDHDSSSPQPLDRHPVRRRAWPPSHSMYSANHLHLYVARSNDARRRAESKEKRARFRVAKEKDCGRARGRGGRQHGWRVAMPRRKAWPTRATRGQRVKDSIAMRPCAPGRVPVLEGGGGEARRLPAVIFTVFSHR